MSSCCGGKCGCGSSCGCGSGCNGCGGKAFPDLTSSSENFNISSSQTSLVVGLPPPTSYLEEEGETAENGGCNCGPHCSCNPCNCK